MPTQSQTQYPRVKHHLIGDKEEANQQPPIEVFLLHVPGQKQMNQTMKAYGSGASEKNLKAENGAGMSE